ncbi:MAG TPA: tetratricopeptide repeat protein, partial [Pyrinomonadaceae bacterium]|nr:tetratricopeptide repeat protein [Pyrinomonadaceae bacterium]
MLNLSNTLYEFGPFRLDLRERLLLQNGEPVPLAPKVFDVLAVLVSRSGSLVQKDELLTEVWPDTTVEESSLSQKIYQLRKTLDDSAGEERYIQTVPRHGYRFIAEVREVTPSHSPSAKFHEAAQPQTENLVAEYIPADRVIEEDLSSENGITSEPVPFIEARSPALTSTRRRRLLQTVVVSIFLLALVVAAGLWLWRRHNSIEPEKGPLRIAVLPFKPLGADQGNELLGLGIADAVIAKLNKMQQVTVLPTSAIYQFSGREYDSFAAGSQLGVDGILDGTVQRTGEHVRVTAQLLTVKDKQILWVGQFDGTFNDIFAIQDSISMQLSQALSPELNRVQREVLTRRDTLNTAAYEAYITGVYFWNKRTKEGITKAIDYFQRAIDADPNYAKAYAGLSDCYSLSLNYGYDIVSTEEAQRRRTAAAYEALKLDSNLAEAHLAVAGECVFRRDYAAAAVEYQKALQLDPGSSIAHLRYAYFSLGGANIERAAMHMKLAQQLDPISPITNAALGFVLMLQRDYAGASKYCERALELDPQTPLVRVTLAVTYEQSGKYDEAMAQYEKVLTENHELALTGMAHVQASMGHRARAKQILGSPAVVKYDTAEGHYNRALVHVALGDNSAAIELLEKINPPPNLVAFLKYDP